MSDDKNQPKIYKEYKYPDGRVLRLTKEEFLKVVDAFRMLLNAERKKEGKPPILGKDDNGDSS